MENIREFGSTIILLFSLIFIIVPGSIVNVAPLETTIEFANIHSTSFVKVMSSVMY